MDFRPIILVIVRCCDVRLFIAAVNFLPVLLLTRVIEREGDFALHAALGAGQETTRQATAYHRSAPPFKSGPPALGLLIALWIHHAISSLSPEGGDATVRRYA